MIQLGLFDTPTESPPDLTPLDLRSIGISLIRHHDGVSWTWTRRSFYGAGTVNGGAQETIAGAIAEARFMERSLIAKGANA